MNTTKIPFKLSDLTYIALLRRIVGIIPEEESALIWLINRNYPYYSFDFIAYGEKGINSNSYNFPLYEPDGPMLGFKDFE